MDKPSDPAGATDAPEVQIAAHAAKGWQGALADGLREAWDWWREAGVDLDFTDAPASWLAEVKADEAGETAGLAHDTPARVSPARDARARETPASDIAGSSASQPSLSRDVAATRSLPPIERVGGDPASWPQDIAGFAAWWRSEPTLSPATPEQRMPPRGRPGAPWMVLVPHPEPDDVETLLAGPQGRLLANMLDAMGIPAGDVYIASALPAFAAHADWATLGEAGLDAVTRHHIALAAPRRLIVLGQRILPLLGHPSAHSAAPLPTINQKRERDRDNRVPGIVSEKGAGDDALRVFPGLGLDNLLQRPGARAGFWRDWLNWSAGG